MCVCVRERESVYMLLVRDLTIFDIYVTYVCACV